MVLYIVGLISHKPNCLKTLKKNIIYFLYSLALSLNIKGSESTSCSTIGILFLTLLIFILTRTAINHWVYTTHMTQWCFSCIISLNLFNNYMKYSFYPHFNNWKRISNLFITQVSLTRERVSDSLWHSAIEPRKRSYFF